MAQKITIRAGTIVLALACAAYLIALVASSALLPERVASHFGWQGKPDGWMSRGTYLLTMAGVGLGLSALFLSIGWIVRHAPASSINLPHRDYWLAPERRDETSSTLSRQFCWLGVLILIFFLGIHALVVEANRRELHELSNVVWLWLALLLVAMFAWGTVLMRRFSHVPTTAG